MPRRGKPERAWNEPPIKHMSSPMGDAAVAHVKNFAAILCEVINGCPTEPDENGHEWIAKDVILAMIDKLVAKQAEQLSSYDFNAWTGEKVSKA